MENMDLSTQNSPIPGRAISHHVHKPCPGRPKRRRHNASNAGKWKIWTYRLRNPPYQEEQLVTMSTNPVQAGLKEEDTMHLMLENGKYGPIDSELPHTSHGQEEQLVTMFSDNVLCLWK
jgi:hypothetical protein